MASALQAPYKPPRVSVWLTPLSSSFRRGVPIHGKRRRSVGVDVGVKH